jgi:hypothetical protein
LIKKYVVAKSSDLMYHVGKRNPHTTVEKRFNTKYPLNALTNLLARNFAEQGGGRRHTGVCQGRQHRYAEFIAINVKVF